MKMENDPASVVLKNGIRRRLGGQGLGSDRDGRRQGKNLDPQDNSHEDELTSRESISKYDQDEKGDEAMKDRMEQELEETEENAESNSTVNDSKVEKIKSKTKGVYGVVDPPQINDPLNDKEPMQRTSNSSESLSWFDHLSRVCELDTSTFVNLDTFLDEHDVQTLDQFIALERDGSLSLVITDIDTRLQLFDSARALKTVFKTRTRVSGESDEEGDISYKLVVLFQVFLIASFAIVFKLVSNSDVQNVMREYGMID